MIGISESPENRRKNEREQLQRTKKEKVQKRTTEEDFRCRPYVERKSERNTTKILEIKILKET